MDFSEAESAYKNANFDKLQNSEEGLLFLKLRTLSRKVYLKELSERIGSDISNLNSKLAFRKMFEEKIPVQLLDEQIRELYLKERNLRKENEDDLINELYKLKAFDWGSLHQNNLEKTIVNNYVKKITSYEEINSKIDSELFHSLRGYTLCSWYNHWTSIIIEDIFKDHDRVLPSVGLVKQIDFFINDIPFDLKVTYFPEGYIKEKRKLDGKTPELTMLKKCARDNGVPYNSREMERSLLEDLWLKISDHHNPSCEYLISELAEYRKSLVDYTVADPTDLIRWLYENQGTRRFDSSNRLFLVLVNQNNYFDSWMLKRMRDLLKHKIFAYLDGIHGCPGQNILFEFDGKEYQTRSDVLIIRK